jgi:hypothetical protein
MSQNSNLAEWLADHPRMMGVLWVLVLIWAETGMALAKHAEGTGGP